MNPYEPPKIPLHDDVQFGAFDGTSEICAVIQFTSTYFREALSRFRRQSRMAHVWAIIRFIAAGAAMILAIVAMQVADYEGTVFLLLVSVAILCSRYLQDVLSIRRLRSSPHYNERLAVRLSTNGYHVNSSLQNTTFNWALFTQAVQYSDGVLLLQGSNVCHWIPYSALSTQTDTARLFEFTTRNIQANKPLHAEPQVARF